MPHVGRKDGDHAFSRLNVALRLRRRIEPQARLAEMDSSLIPVRTGLAEALRGRSGIKVYEIGDAVRTAKVLDALHAGFKLTRRL